MNGGLIGDLPWQWGASCLDETETLRRALQKDQRHQSTQHRRHAMLTMSPIHAKSPRRGSVRHQHQCRRVDSGTGLQPVQAKTMKTLAQGQRGVLRNQLMAWAKSPLGRGDDLPLSKLAAHGKSILTECDADGGERRPYRPLTQYQLVARNSSRKSLRMHTLRSPALSHLAASSESACLAASRPIDGSARTPFRAQFFPYRARHRMRSIYQPGRLRPTRAGAPCCSMHRA